VKSVPGEVLALYVTLKGALSAFLGVWGLICIPLGRLRPRDVNWTSIVLELGYYDQPHLIDDFRSLPVRHQAIGFVRDLTAESSAGRAGTGPRRISCLNNGQCPIFLPGPITR